MVLAGLGFFWQAFASLQQERDATRRDLQVALQAWNQAGMAARSASGDAVQTDTRRLNFVADTLLPLYHPFLMTVFFGLSTDTDGGVGVDTAVRVVNASAAALAPRARLAFHDYLGNEIGAAALDASHAVDGDGAAALQPDEMRLYRLRVPVETGAIPAWFAVHWGPK